MTSWFLIQRLTLAFGGEGSNDARPWFGQIGVMTMMFIHVSPASNTESDAEEFNFFVTAVRSF